MGGRRRRPAAPAARRSRTRHRSDGCSPRARVTRCGRGRSCRPATRTWAESSARPVSAARPGRRGRRGARSAAARRRRSARSAARRGRAAQRRGRSPPGRPLPRRAAASGHAVAEAAEERPLADAGRGATASIETFSTPRSANRAGRPRGSEPVAGGVRALASSPPEDRQVDAEATGRSSGECP